MSKKTGSFFKSVLSKGKSIFKKNDKPEEKDNQEDMGTEEDNDFIEVGKQGQKIPSSSILSNISDLAGQTLLTANHFLHGTGTSQHNNH